LLAASCIRCQHYSVQCKHFGRTYIPAT
jgi:hypothetical protein